MPHDEDDLTCMQASELHPEACAGRTELRMSVSPSGKSFPRCDRHWEQRLQLEAELNERYPAQQPADFDPDYAGESWYEEESIPEYGR